MRRTLFRPFALLAALPLAASAQQARTLPAPNATYDEPFSQVGGLRELSNGRVIVSDGRDKIVSFIDLATGSAEKVGREGSGPGEFGLPTRLFMAPGDTTLLFDPLNTRYLVIGPDGKPKTTFMIETAVCGYTSNGLIGVHLIPHAVDHGFPKMVASGAMGLMGAMNVVGTTASGYIADRYGKRIPLAMYYFLRGLSLFFLLGVASFGELNLFAIIFGLNYISTVPPTSMLTADLLRKAVGGGALRLDLLRPPARSRARVVLRRGRVRSEGRL